MLLCAPGCVHFRYVIWTEDKTGNVGNSALQKYKAEGHDTIILAGAEYGSGSSRDWAAKGPYLQVRHKECQQCVSCHWSG